MENIIFSKEQLSDISYKGFIRRLMSAENKELYSESIKAYDDFTTYASYLVQVLSYPKNVFSAITVINSLLYKGVFSNNRKFTQEHPNGENVEGALGLNVVAGIGNTRNICAFTNDVLRKMGFNSETIYCYVSSEPNVKNGNQKSNQALNLIEHEGVLYGYDHVDNSFYRFIENGKLVEMNTTRPLYAYYNPMLEVILNGTSVEGVNNLVSVFDKVKDMKPISKSDMQFYLEYTARCLEHNETLLKESWVHLGPLAEKIAKEVTNNKSKKHVK